MTAPAPSRRLDAATSHYTRPIKVISRHAGDSVWACRHCPAFGWSTSSAAAADAGLAHLDECPHGRQALDRLLAAVMALPTYRIVHFNGPAGMLVCRPCNVLVEDRTEHDWHHLHAAGLVDRG